MSRNPVLSHPVTEAGQRPSAFSPDLALVHELSSGARATAMRRYYGQLAVDLLLSRRPMTQAPLARWRDRAVDDLWADVPQAPRPPASVTELSNADATFGRLMAASERYRYPVVIRGFGETTAAVRKWSGAYLAERLGDGLCTVVEMDDAANDRPHEAGRVLHQMPFTEFIQRMPTERLYLHNSTEFAARSPELLDELEIARIGDRFTTPGSTWDEIFASNLFVGSEMVFSNLHCAPGGNFFLQVAGRKTWTLVDPSLSPYLRPVPSRPFNHCLSAYGSYRHHPEGGPLHRLPRQVVTLEPGDLLYNPPWWWHEVSNHGETIGCALRHVPPPFRESPTVANHRVFSALSMYPTLWGYSALNYARHRIKAGGAPMRAKVNDRLARELNRARGRQSGAS